MVGGKSTPVVWPGVVVHVVSDNEDGGENPYRIPKADTEKEGTENHIWDVGNTLGQRDVEGV